MYTITYLLFDNQIIYKKGDGIINVSGFCDHKPRRSAMKSYLFVLSFYILLVAIVGQFPTPTDIPAIGPWRRPKIEIPEYGTILGGTAFSWYKSRKYNFFHGLYYGEATTNLTRFLVSY